MRFRPALACALLLLSACSGVDQTNLQAVATDYFRQQAPEKIWAYRSKLSRADTALAEMKPLPAPPKKVSVLGERETGGIRYGLVQAEYLVQQSSGSCADVETTTWTLEERAWRRIKLEKPAAKSNRLLEQGNTSAALEVANDWVQADPYGVEAWNLLFHLRQRLNDPPGQEVAAWRLLSINPDDSQVLFDAIIASAADPDRAQTYLERMKPNDCSRPDSAFLVAMSFCQARRTKEALQLLEHEPVHPATLLLRLDLLRLSDQNEKLAHLLSAKNDALLKADMERRHSRGARLVGQAYLQIGNLDQARRWLRYARSTEPDDPLLGALSDRIAIAEARPTPPPYQKDPEIEPYRR